MKMIMMNLFETFDPSINYYFQLNWIFMFTPIIMFPNMYWLIPSRIMMILKLFIKYLFNEYKMIMLNKYIMNIILFLSIMIYIMLLNLFSLIPYIFTSTSHLLFNLSMSLSLWMSFMIYSIINFPLKTLSHLVPLNSPKFLMNFMVIIELISLIIRPWTLSIRLSANLISGHLILILLSNFMMNFLLFLPITLIIQNMLLTLEISMALIQAYVFSILLTLYFSESN
uniref:ATP synthase subunit a n=2 Tax=Bombus hypocrita TaxID=130701 RepID=B8Q9C4_BOMHP|nr:ATP synthase F0 subunit 6 [Bombus hypocrita sapporensis]BAW89020.1 ATP synthase F0 subunit 6 [Bombus hypocrita hypocrita]ABY75175.1 ATP synthase F0 subunit 6 [Bombus hypocrita sapporensis]BAV93030.1 ATP synthase F0 subunit 6 [Bombus hypocrita sapporensis]BBC15081.1 ATP synthase F0 subunit 6 [Bombus hypocrita sapporensis]BBC44260.1 ATP synthase F0 subunit 6 [Bombus hypocrita sapporensis]